MGTTITASTSYLANSVLNKFNEFLPVFDDNDESKEIMKDYREEV